MNAFQSIKKEIERIETAVAFIEMHIEHLEEQAKTDATKIDELEKKIEELQEEIDCLREGAA